jgi:hypothetical protein
MRPLAIVPALCCATALILTFLAYFAGHKKGFMEDYHLLTLNTSRIGYDLVDIPESPFSLFRNISDSLESGINDAVGSLAERVGVEDFYSAHILGYCFGTYLPAPLANETVDDSDIHKSVAGCSNRTAMYHFDPTAALNDSLARSGLGVTLGELNWPEDIDNGIEALRILQRVVFVLYCISLGLMFMALITAIWMLIASGRVAAVVTALFASLAFLAVGIASGIVTAFVVKGANVINEYGRDIGVEAHRGNKFLALTWAATGLMLVATVLSFIDLCLPHHRKTNYVKHG